HGHVELIRDLAAKGMDVMVPGEEERTALHIAAKHGHADIIRALLKAKPGLWVNAPSEGYKEMTALHYAVVGDHIEAARALLENGASMSKESAYSQFKRLTP